jgi:hypothetical protein
VRAAADAISADLGRPDQSVSLPIRRDGRYRSPGENAAQMPLPPLEAGEPRVHDPKRNGSAIADGRDRGVAYEA